MHSSCIFLYMLYVGFLNSGGQILCQMQVCLWEEIHNTWKDLTAKSCSYVRFPFEEPKTKGTAFFHFCTQCATLVCIHSFVNLWLMTNLNPWHMCWETFQGFFLRGGKSLESTADVNSDCIHITSKRSHGLVKKLIDSQNLRIHLDWSVPSFPCFPYRSNYFRRASKDPKATLVTLPTLSQTA